MLSQFDIEQEVKKYRMIFDYHTHTTFSHGKGSIEDNVKVAISKGLEGIAISDHGPGHLTYGVKRKNFSVMAEEVKRLRKIYPQIQIYLSVEANIKYLQPYIDVREDEKKYLDFLMAGYHFGIFGANSIENWIYTKVKLGENGYKKLEEKNTAMVNKALNCHDIKILTHPGDKGPFNIHKIAKTCAKRGTWMEINNWRHPHLSVEEIKIAAKEDVKFVISSDAHDPQYVGGYENALKRAIEAGLDLDRIVNIEKV